VSAVLLREPRDGILLAREALEGTDSALAAAALRDPEEQVGQALAEAIRQRRRPRRRRLLCESCGVCFDWPGELAKHRQRVHGAGEAA
jgi:hypothetical protein